METIICHSDIKEKSDALRVFLKELKIPFEEVVEYNNTFVEKIKRSRDDFESGRYKAIETKDLWK